MTQCIYANDHWWNVALTFSIIYIVEQNSLMVRIRIQMSGVFYTLIVVISCCSFRNIPEQCVSRYERQVAVL